MKIPLFVLLTGIVLFASCKKDKDAVTGIQTDVYVAGSHWDPVTGLDKSAVWKNGTLSANTLSSNYRHYANAIAINGNDIYTTGFENRPSEWKCHVWKNGQHQYELGDVFSFGNGIAISGNDVYVAGGTNEGPGINRSMLWKNTDASGINILATGPGIQATSVVVSGSDVYVCGQDASSAKIWKNGIAILLSNSTSCYVNELAIDGADVYAAGYTNSSVIRYWKNGISTDISTPGLAYANAITISNGDVYIAGQEIVAGKGIAKYWKNGVAVTLGDGVRHSRANGIAVKGTDVYVCGEIQGSTNLSDYATLWKNGQATTIGLQNSRATAIVIK